MYDTELIVGILQPTPYGVSGEIVQGFLDADGKSRKQFKPYISSSFSLSAPRMRVLAHELVRDIKPDIVVTIGSAATDAYLKVAAEQECATPVISIISAGIAKNLAHNLENCPSVAAIEFEPNNMLHASRYLHAIKPHVKKILVPYSSGRLSIKAENDVDIIKNYFSRRGITVTAMPTKSMVESYHDICAQLDQHDTLMLLECDLPVERHRAFAHECSKKDVTLFSCAIDAPFFGSSLGYAMNCKPLGTMAFAYAKRIIFEGFAAGNLPLHTEKDKRTLYVNTHIAPSQGLRHEDITRVLSLLQVQEVDQAEILLHRPEYAKDSQPILHAPPSQKPPQLR